MSTIHLPSWTGTDLPGGWEYRRLKHVVRCLDGRRIPLNATQRGEKPGPFPYWGANGVVDHLDEYLFDEPLVLLGEDGAPFFEYGRDVAFHVEEPVWVNNHIHVLRPVEIEPRFLTHWLNTVEYGDFVDGSTRDKLTQGKMLNIPLMCPPLPTQRAIADFLDRKTAAIDALIEKKERLIALLAEKRAALIHRAVTKGLDPDVPMKDSGVPWIGEIPAHWEVTAIKRFARPGRKTFTDGDWIESPYITDEGVRLIQTGNVGTGEYREKGFRYVSNETFKKLRCVEVKPGDVLICRLDGPVGRACLAPDLGVKMITSVDNAILKPAIQHDARYVNYGLNLPTRLHWIGSLVQVGGGHRWRISRSMLGALFLPAPPSQEQREIADHLDSVTKGMVQASDRIAVQVVKLHEYRQSLITSAVTGQLDIPGEDAA